MRELARPWAGRGCTVRVELLGVPETHRSGYLPGYRSIATNYTLRRSPGAPGSLDRVGGMVYCGPWLTTITAGLIIAGGRTTIRQSLTTGASMAASRSSQRS